MVQDIHKKIGIMSREYREKEKMTQLELANKLGYDTIHFVSLMECGHSKVPLKILGKLIVILGMNEKSIKKELVSHYENEIKNEIALGKKALQTI